MRRVVQYRWAIVAAAMTVMLGVRLAATNSAAVHLTWTDAGAGYLRGTIENRTNRAIPNPVVEVTYDGLRDLNPWTMHYKDAQTYTARGGIDEFGMGDAGYLTTTPDGTRTVAVLKPGGVAPFSIMLPYPMERPFRIRVFSIPWFNGTDRQEIELSYSNEGER